MAVARNHPFHTDIQLKCFIRQHIQSVARKNRLTGYCSSQAAFAIDNAPGDSYGRYAPKAFLIRIFINSLFPLKKLIFVGVFPVLGYARVTGISQAR